MRYITVFLSILVFLIFRVESTGVMPVDDTYIHFQYAKQVALGQPYVYNPGLEPTSGATSFLYPYVLSVGYLLGFQGLNLGTWAMLVGMAALAGAGWVVLKLTSPENTTCRDTMYRGHPLIAAAFVLNGAVAWHFMSGMETGLMIFFSLATLYTFTARQIRWFAIAATLLALTRPEGSIMAVIAAGVWAVDDWRCQRRIPFLWLALPVLALGVQPAVNLLITHSASASGNQAKSLFGMIPFYFDEVLKRILDNFVTIWGEFFSGVTANGIWYLPPLTGMVALAGLWRVWHRDKALAVLLVLWLVGVSAAISTLDTAFWHFKRYQMPLMALLYVMAVWGIYPHPLTPSPKISEGEANGRNESRPYIKWARYIVPLQILTILLLAFSVWTVVEFRSYYMANVQNVQAQPLAMAQWLKQHTPPDAVVAVHDVGMMRYIGERTTVDMVGLTTSGAADYWRNGPGAVAEFLEKQRPDYVAAYTGARGLGYLADTGIYGEELAGFTAEYDPRINVALGDSFQGIYKTQWTVLERSGEVKQPSTLAYVKGMTLIDQVDVADLESEVKHSYQWREVNRLTGFATEVYQLAYVGCGNCVALDGGRRFDGVEAFTVKTRPGEDMILVMRIHPAQTTTFDVYVNEHHIATRWIPAIPGQWLEIATLIPAEMITGETTDIRIESRGVYMPYHHWVYQGRYDAGQPGEAPLAAFGGLVLENIETRVENGQLIVRLDWYSDGSANGDGVMFVHVYDDVNQPPIAQGADRRLWENTLPPGNMLAGAFSDTFVVDLIDRHDQIAIGFYDPITGERIPPVMLDESVSVDAGRLFIRINYEERADG